MSLASCRLVELPVLSDPRGNLTVVEHGAHTPFAFERAYYLYGVPEGEARGGHAHKNLHQFMIALSGGFDVHIEDGKGRRSIRLDRPDQGLYICPMIWRELDNFSASSICLVLASAVYDEDDYIRDYDTFLSVAARR